MDHHDALKNYLNSRLAWDFRVWDLGDGYSVVEQHSTGTAWVTRTPSTLISELTINGGTWVTRIKE